MQADGAGARLKVFARSCLLGILLPRVIGADRDTLYTYIHRTPRRTLYTLHPLEPLNPTPYTLYTLHPLHPTPHTLHPLIGAKDLGRG